MPFPCWSWTKPEICPKGTRDVLQWLWTVSHEALPVSFGLGTRVPRAPFAGGGSLGDASSTTAGCHRCFDPQKGPWVPPHRFFLPLPVLGEGRASLGPLLGSGPRSALLGHGEASRGDGHRMASVRQGGVQHGRQRPRRQHFFDLLKFYELIPLRALEDRCHRLRFHPTIAGVCLAAYRSARYLVLSGVVASPVFAEVGLVAGCVIWPPRLSGFLDSRLSIV